VYHRHFSATRGEYVSSCNFPFTGYWIGLLGLSLLSIGGKIFKWIAIVTNSIFVVFSLVGIVHFAIISPLSGGVFDTVALVGCIIFGVVGGVTVKLLKKASTKLSKEKISDG